MLERRSPYEPVDTSVTFGWRAADVIVRLIEACAEASEDEETEPVRPDTFNRAEEFAKCLPPRLPIPDVFVHPDGEIAFEWHLAKDRVLTVSVGPDQMVAFAALIGASSVYGRERFDGFIPDQVAHLLDRVVKSPAV
jgi:hypothetical protein